MTESTLYTTPFANWWFTRFPSLTLPPSPYAVAQEVWEMKEARITELESELATAQEWKKLVKAGELVIEKLQADLAAERVASKG